jgi:aldehyde dehydrogenase
MSTAAVWTQDAIFEEAFATIRKGGVRSRYDNFIGGKWVAPSQGKYFADHSPINGVNLAEFARSSACNQGRVGQHFARRPRCGSKPDR